MLLGLGLGVMVVFDSGLYAVLAYRVHDGRLPLGEAALFVHDTLGTPVLLAAALVILLFPDWTRSRLGVEQPGRLSGAAGARDGMNGCGPT